MNLLALLTSALLAAHAAHAAALPQIDPAQFCSIACKTHYHDCFAVGPPALPSSTPFLSTVPYSFFAFPTSSNNETDVYKQNGCGKDPACYGDATESALASFKCMYNVCNALTINGRDVSSTVSRFELHCSLSYWPPPAGYGMLFSLN